MESLILVSICPHVCRHMELGKSGERAEFENMHEACETVLIEIIAPREPLEPN